MKKENKILLSLLTAITFSIAACDCVRHAEGVILDKHTKTIIDSVAISTVDIQRNSLITDVKYSGKGGRFQYHIMESGFNCPDLVLYFYKKGYRQNKATFDSNNKQDTVWLERVN